MSHRTISSHRPALYVVLPYLVASLVYIFCSDLILERLVTDTDVLRWVQTAKGWAFVLMTAVALYVMIQWQVQAHLRAERRTMEQEAQFRNVFDYAVSGMTILDPQGKIIRINDVLLKMLGYTREEVAGTTVIDYTHPDDRASRQAYFTRQLEGERPETPLEVRYRHKDGRYLWVLVSSVLIRDADGKPTCFISQVVDITERRRAEEELLEHRAVLAHASRLITLGELAAGLTHELTQPLTAIGQYADVAMRRVHEDREPVSPTLREAVDGVYEEAVRAREIVSRWRSFARGQNPRPAAVHPNQLVHDAMRLLGREARREGIRYRLDLRDNLPPVAADHVQIEQVLVNLIGNAIDAVAARPPNDREIAIRTWQADGRNVGISVADNGPGIDTPSVPHLFEPFFTTKPEGIGLGLPISRSIIQSHGGRIAMDRVDGWTVFHFELPVSQEQSHAAA